MEAASEAVEREVAVRRAAATIESPSVSFRCSGTARRSRAVGFDAARHLGGHLSQRLGPVGGMIAKVMRHSILRRVRRRRAAERARHGQLDGRDRMTIRQRAGANRTTEASCQRPGCRASRRTTRAAGSRDRCGTRTAARARSDRASNERGAHWRIQPTRSNADVALQRRAGQVVGEHQRMRAGGRHAHHDGEFAGAGHTGLSNPVAVAHQPEADAALADVALHQRQSVPPQRAPAASQTDTGTDPFRRRRRLRWFGPLRLRRVERRRALGRSPPHRADQAAAISSCRPTSRSAGKV